MLFAVAAELLQLNVLLIDSIKVIANFPSGKSACPVTFFPPLRFKYPFAFHSFSDDVLLSKINAATAF